MRLNRREALAALGAAALVGPEAGGAGPERCILPGIDRYRVVDPVFEAVRVVLAKRGETFSPAYLQGISGSAFRIGGPCACGPTCVGAMSPDGLARLCGYEATHLAYKEGQDPGAWLAQVLPRIKAEIRAGRPVIVFNAFTTAEWDVVCGFDEAAGQFYGRGSYVGTGRGYARADQARTISSAPICGIIGPTLIGARTGPLDARRAERAALEEALRHARSTSHGYPYPGLQCYQVWIGRFRADPPQGPEWGADGYTSGVYRSTHRAAAAFLREMAPKHPEAAPHLERGARCFAREASSLSRLRDLLFEPPAAQVPSDTDEVAPAPSARARSDRAAALLAAARDAYAAGIDAIEAALRRIPE